MVGVGVGEHDLLNVAGADAQFGKRLLPYGAGFAGVEAGVYHCPAVAPAQQIAVDNPQGIGQRELNLKNVVGDGENVTFHGVIERLSNCLDRVHESILTCEPCLLLQMLITAIVSYADLL